MKLDAYISLRELADKLGIQGADRAEAVRLRLKRRGIPTRKILGTRMVLKVSLDEAMTRELGR